MSSKLTAMPLLFKSAGLVIVYLAAAKVGLLFGVVNSSVTIFWPPGGIALAVLLMYGVRYLPAVFIGAYLAAVMVKAPIIFALGSSIGNTLETYLGYLLLSRFGKVDLSLNRTNDFLGLIALGAMIPAIASATLGPLTLMASGIIDVAALPDIMWRWWRSDVLGIVFFTPTILMFSIKTFGIPKDLSARQEWIAIWICAFVAGQIVLLGWRPFGIAFEEQPQLVWLFAVIIWAGLRTGRGTTGIIQLMFLGQALISAHLHIGFFADDFVRYGLANFWMFALMLATGGTLLAILGNEQRRSAELLKRQAQFDSLTGLPSRPLFYDRFEQQLANANRHSTKFAVIFIDLDKFKPVNDTFGHQLGDQLLVSVANRLTDLVREIDTVSRFGGDEFVIIVSDVDISDNVVSLAEKILGVLSQPFYIGSQLICISGSLGIAVYPNHGKDMHTLLKCADEAMYQAKKIGNTYVLASMVFMNLNS